MIEKYTPVNHIRIVSATSLFDGHDASINIMRRIIQSCGVEVIHLGHNRPVKEIIDCAIQEDANAIAITSYQGGHIEFFKYMLDLLKEAGRSDIKIFGGGGGVILPAEIEELEKYGVSKIFSPDDGRKMGLIGMINYLLKMSDFSTIQNITPDFNHLKKRDFNTVGKFITIAENNYNLYEQYKPLIVEAATKSNIPVLGITGTGGAGKSSLTDEIIRRFLLDFKDKSIAIISIDPSKRKTGGALLGDRIRMNSIASDRVYLRSMATRGADLAVSEHIADVIQIAKAASFDLIIIETSGIGQADSTIADISDLALYVMTPEFGAQTQLEKIDMLDFADIIALNKFDKRGGEDALKAVKKQFQRNHELFDENIDDMPAYGTIASQYNDQGTDSFYKVLIELINKKAKEGFKSTLQQAETKTEKLLIIPPLRVRYLSEITAAVREYNIEAEKQSDVAQKMYSIRNTIDISEDESVKQKLEALYQNYHKKLTEANVHIINTWEDKKKIFKDEFYVYTVRNKEYRVKTHSETLSHLQVPKVVTPSYKAWGDILNWVLQENVPGDFPFTSGVFPFKRESESPTRMFAGEGGPERTNKRFHYLSKGQLAARLSTAFDSVTLYGENPDKRPDIYGKIGNSGVSICCLDDAKKLYSGFDLCDPKTSVSMTINGPAPIMTAYFLNAAIDQQCEKYIYEHGLENEVKKKIEEKYSAKGLTPPTYQGNRPDGNDGLGLLLLGITGDEILPADIYNDIKNQTLAIVRGTIQADILKEDQAQNTCIFSIDFALKLMGDVQEFFINNSVTNFYSVSISGYHIAEAGANPVTQLAFTLANGFTYVEYYLSRGMDIDKFAPNLSFFFSNGMDAEFSVIGRVARRIWAKAMKHKYNANTRSQKLKYHIQTSGRSLHAQEIDFNDIRTTLQALYAVYDNCNSLHTNAYDEAITTPTEESVRRAMAIQLIIDQENGLSKNQNPLQGAFIIEELTKLVEEAVLVEFDKISDRDGVLGAMETMYQRNKIQEESHYYESLKHNGELPIIGVNTFLSSEGSPTLIPGEVIRATEEEKKHQINTLNTLHKVNTGISDKTLTDLKYSINQNENAFDKLMEVSKNCSIGQITNALFEVGGQYRRNM